MTLPFASPPYGLALLALPLLTLACSSSRVVTNQDPKADFGVYRTYGFVSEPGTDTAEYSSLLSEFLKVAATRELEARNYTESDEPDMLVNFDLYTQEKIQSTTTTAGHGGRSRHGRWAGYETTVNQYTEGTLSVDLVDRKKNQLVWQGVIVGRVTQKARKNLEVTIDDAIAEVFAEYPYVAGQSQPLLDDD